MKIALTVAQGVHEGKSIPINLPQFLIGRDPGCQLRPASLAISKRHCSITTRGDKVFIRDFDSTNGTAVNDVPLKGEVELHDKDRLKVGPLNFVIVIQVGVPAEKSAPVPQPVGGPPAANDEDDMAAMMLGLQDGDSATSTNAGEDSVPGGSTVMEVPAVTGEPGKPGETGKTPTKAQAAKANSANTSSAAEAILKKYMRRPRA